LDNKAALIYLVMKEGKKGKNSKGKKKWPKLWGNLMRSGKNRGPCRQQGGMKGSAKRSGKRTRGNIVSKKPLKAAKAISQEIIQGSLNSGDLPVKKIKDEQKGPKKHPQLDWEMGKKELRAGEKWGRHLAIFPSRGKEACGSG